MMFHKLFLTMKEFFSQEGSLYRSSLSYSFLLMLFPGLIVVVMLIQNGIINSEDTMLFLYQYLPQELIEPFISFIITNDYTTIHVIVVTIGAISFLASKAIYSFMLISANDEDIKAYGFFIRVKSIFVFVVFILGLIVLGLLSKNMKTGMFGTVGIMMTLLFYGFYRVISFIKRPWNYGIIGAVFASVGIMFVGYAFLSIIHLTSYRSIYGPLSSLLVMILSIHIISGIIYFGYCLNHTYNYHYPTVEYKHHKMYSKINNFLRNIKKNLTK